MAKKTFGLVALSSLVALGVMQPLFSVDEKAVKKDEQDVA